MKKSSINIFEKYKISFLSLLGLLTVASVTWKPIATGYGKWLAAGEDNPTGDMSVLLSGNNRRLESLIELYETGNVEAVYYAAGIDETTSELEGYRNIFARYDIPSDDLYCGELVESTFNEAQAFQRKLKEIEQPIDKIVLVSDRYHLRRGIWSFRKVFGDDIELAAYSAAPSSPEMSDPQWWKYHDSRRYVISETKKIAFYWLYYGLLNRSELITHGDINKITTGESSKGVKNPCQIVLPQLTSTN